MKILITGASGFLGGHMAEMFVEAGHHVRAFVRRTSRTELLERLGLEMVRGDLKDHDSLRKAVAAMEVVVHAASTTSGVPQEFVEATVRGTRALLATAEKAGVKRFVHLSSIGVVKMPRRADRRPIAEDAPYEDDPALLTNYIQSKIGAEREVLEFARDGRMQVIVLRPGILYGPRGRWNLARMGYALGANGYVIIGNGGNTLPVCYVRNCASAVLRAAESAHAEGIFNVVDDESFTQLEYLRRLKEDVRPRLKIVCLPYLIARALGKMAGMATRPLGRPSPLRPAHLIACQRRLAYSNQRAKEALGWRPETGKEEALAATMHSYAERERVSRRADLRLLGRPPKGEPPLTACLVGCGVIAQEHLKVLSRMPNAKVLALCDLNRDAARDLAQRFNVPRTYDDVAAMLDAERPGVLHILTPPQSHAMYAELAAHKGCNVLVEKPMAVDAAEARRMADCAAEHGVQICVDHNCIYEPQIVRARRRIQSGALGDLIWVESYYGFDLGGSPAITYMLPGGEKHWTFRLPGGLYQNLAPHPLCLALELLGPPRRVHAHARYGRVLPHQPTDELRIILETETASGVVTVSLAASPRFHYLSVFGTEGALFVDVLNKWLIPHVRMRGVPKTIARAIMNMRHGCTVLRGTLGGMLKVLMRRWTPYEGMALLIREYYAALQEERDPPVSAEEGIAVMEVMDKVWDIIGSQALDAQANEDIE